MALTKSSGGAIFLSIANGKIVRQFKEANENTTQRTTKTGRVVFEEFFKNVSGVIKQLQKKETDFGNYLSVTIDDGEDRYYLEMNYSSRYAASFLKTIPNINLQEPVRVMPWEMKDKQDAAKKITGITCYQQDVDGWKKILPYFTKDNPNGLPQMKQVKVKGQLVWDDSEMMQFLFDNAILKIKNAAEEEAPF